MKEKEAILKKNWCKDNFVMRDANQFSVLLWHCLQFCLVIGLYIYNCTVLTIYLSNSEYCTFEYILQYGGEADEQIVDFDKDICIDSAEVRLFMMIINNQFH